ncbi:GntR family transcriptional regulator [Streptosporangium sp. DT93]|uniref:GntR family transcriptional regulator n=1 Tax=Streptosporangium sp. DT93 TaxID=3393428 RepID=UPI003CF45BD5
MRPDDRHPSHQVAADLRKQIMAGRLKPEEQLPSTAQLATAYDVVPTTIQNAVRILKEEGFLVGKAGKGVYVRDRHPFVVDASAYYDPASRGVSYRMLNVVPDLAAPADVAEALGEDRAALRYRMTLRGDEPLELSWSYYPLSLAAGTPLTGRGKIRGGAPAVLAGLGHPQQEFVDEVSSRSASREEAELLELPSGLSVLEQFRVIYSDAGRPVEVSILVKAGHLYKLRYRQTIPAEG